MRSIAGNFMVRWEMLASDDYAGLGINRDASRQVFERLTCDLPDLSARLRMPIVRSRMALHLESTGI